ncbi:histone-lysine N-methyltransferase PRDM9 [Lepeophtheirus salmonis]|uniref:histone-lysine N-methyltransferase PRDM9 n=1 Tax=Lepeophtheirus salmonis TaxID=72036 RepID=UPI001AE7F33F|nr:PR domain zinc finger protein 14-like [Lepeophtheirus salmonis]XP_040563842.1 PR domain zinc finger protein 14-like [Lepeophtheirus salmonis]
MINPGTLRIKIRVALTKEVVLVQKKQITDLSNMTYGEAPMDHFLYCEYCNDYLINGCIAHPFSIMDGSNLVCVNKSRIENAGRGVFNISKQTFEKNTLFGPYLGSFYTTEDYLSKNIESGYPCKILDSNLKSVIGFVDPGMNPDTQTNWLSMVNTSPNIYEQNLTPVQYKGSIYYQVNKAIPPHLELLTYYGDDYTSTIRRAKDIYNPRIMGFKCSSCNISFSKNEYLSIHLDNAHKVLESTALHQVKLIDHIGTVYEKIKKIKCSYCSSFFTRSESLKRHIEAVHEKIKKFKCSYCSSSFTEFSSLQMHVMTFHE